MGVLAGRRLVTAWVPVSFQVSAPPLRLMLLPAFVPVPVKAARSCKIVWPPWMVSEPVKLLADSKV